MNSDNNPQQNETSQFKSLPIYGKNAVTALLKSGKEVDTVLLSESLDEKTTAYFTALAKSIGAVVKKTRNEKLNFICGRDSVHQGVAAFAAEIEYSSIEEILQFASEKNEPPFLLIADGVEDPHNLGALMRTAYLCGAHGIVIPKRGGSSVTPVVMKSSAGAAAFLPVAKVANIGEAVRRLKAQNVFVYCADMQGPAPFKENLTGAIALVMGGEGSGVSPLVKKLCDGSLALPMANSAGGIDSFNVSVAGGVLLYEIYRQRENSLIF